MRPLLTHRASRAVPHATAVAVATAVLLLNSALAGCSGSSGTADGKSTSPPRSGPSRTDAAASGRTTVTFTPRSAPGDETLRHTADLLRARATAIGLKDALIEVHGNSITATTSSAAADRLRQLSARAELGFRPVLGSDTAVPPALRQQFAAYDCKAPVTTPAVAPSDPMVACDPTGPVKYALGAAALTGRDVTGAKASSDTQLGNGWTVNLDLTSAGGAKFAQVTSTLSQQGPPANQIGIVLDRRVLSAPSVAQTITGGKVQISGSFTQAAAEDLAAQISSGALPVDLIVSGTTRIPS
jgi:preprotein translocase subunit SecD